MAKKGSKSGRGKRGKGKAAAQPARSSRSSTVVAAVVAVGLAAVIGYVLVRGQGEGGTGPGSGDMAESQETRIYRVPLGDAPVKGPADALVTIVEWSDFQCPHCSKAAKTMGQILDRFEGKVRLAFRNNPLPGHRNAQAAAEAALAAGDQGRFWEYHDLLFRSQAELQEQGAPFLIEAARRLDLDMARFEKSLEDRQHRPQVLADQTLLRELGQSGTPMFFINGRLVRGARPLEDFVRIVEEEEARARRLLEAGTKRGDLYDALVRDGIAPRPRRERGEEAEASTAEPVEIPRNPEGPGLGPAKAPVHVVEFFDFQCPACRAVPPELHKLHDAFPEDVRIEFRMFPLPFHKGARSLAEIALAAHEQGRYDEVADLLFSKQDQFRGSDTARARDLGLEVASEVDGIDADKLRRDVASGRFRETIDRDFALGEEVQLKATPTIYIDGVPATRRSFEALSAQVEAVLAKRPRSRDGGPGPADGGGAKRTP